MHWAAHVGFVSCFVSSAASRHRCGMLPCRCFLGVENRRKYMSIRDSLRRQNCAEHRSRRWTVRIPSTSVKKQRQRPSSCRHQKCEWPIAAARRQYSFLVLQHRCRSFPRRFKGSFRSLHQNRSFSLVASCSGLWSLQT